MLELVRPDGLSSFLFKDDRLSHFHYDWHHHGELELTLIVRGRGMRMVGDSIETFRDGDLCLLGPHIPHTWTSEPGHGKVRALVAQFRPGFLGEGFLRLKETGELARLFEASAYGLAVEGNLRDQVTDMVREMAAAPAGSALRLARLITALSLLASGGGCRRLSRTRFAEGGDRTDRAADKAINRICAAIQEDLADPPSQDEAARMAGMSPSAFSRYFKRRAGKTYLEYVNELRVGTASRALLDSDKSIADIAFAAGFNNLSHFNRIFRRVNRMTPSRFRELGGAG